MSNSKPGTLIFFAGRPLDRSPPSDEETQRRIDHAYGRDMDEWIVTGATACPKDKTLRQREKYFSGIKFSTLEELLQRAEKVEFI